MGRSRLDETLFLETMLGCEYLFSQENRLPGAEKGPSAPGGDGFRCQVDEVGFQGVYLVHRVWLRRASGAGAVDLVQAFKVDLVH